MPKSVMFSLRMHSFTKPLPILAEASLVAAFVLHEMVYSKCSPLSRASTPAVTAVYTLLDVYFVSVNFLGIFKYIFY